MNIRIVIFSSGKISLEKSCSGRNLLLIQSQLMRHSMKRWMWWFCLSDHIAGDKSTWRILIWTTQTTRNLPSIMHVILVTGAWMWNDSPSICSHHFSIDCSGKLPWKCNLCLVYLWSWFSFPIQIKWMLTLRCSFTPHYPHTCIHTRQHTYTQDKCIHTYTLTHIQTEFVWMNTLMWRKWL